MRDLESKAVGELLRSIEIREFPEHCINIGAGDILNMKKRKPWVEENVFHILAERRCSLIHTDLFNFEGIDKTLDLSQTDCLDFTGTILGTRLFLCANVLEHLTPKTRVTAVKAIATVLKPGDFLLVTVPQRYPYHPDPIDTMFRPSPDELSALFDIHWLKTQTVEAGSFSEDLKGMPLLKRIRKLIKPFWVFQSPRHYISNIHRLTFLTRPYRISLVFGRKVS